MRYPPSAAYSFPICQQIFSLEIILAATIKKMNVTIKELKSDSRQGILPKARRVYFYNAFKYTKEKRFTIAALINKDHSTATLAIKKAKEIDIGKYGEQNLYNLDLTKYHDNKAIINKRAKGTVESYRQDP